MSKKVKNGLKKYGDDFSWPPYPQALVIPDFIQELWNYNNHSKTLNQKEKVFLSVGDRFNAVVLPKKEKKDKYIQKDVKELSNFFIPKVS